MRRISLWWGGAPDLQIGPDIQYAIHRPRQGDGSVGLGLCADPAGQQADATDDANLDGLAAQAGVVDEDGLDTRGRLRIRDGHRIDGGAAASRK